MATVEDRSPTFETVFETINWLYLLCKCEIKTKTHFEWLLWHWSSLGQLNLEPTRPNGLVGCKVPADLVKISVKEATHVFSCDQAALWMVQSVRLSVRPSVCPSVRLSVTPFWLCSHHRIIMKFSGIITSDKSDVHAKGQGQRSKVKVTEVTT